METELQSLTRREFSITTAVTAVACVTGIPTSAICESTHKKKLQIGIIGTCGANTDIRSLIFWLDEQIKIHDHPANIRIIGISESNLRLQNKYTNIVNKKYGMGCTGYSSFQEMLQKESGKIDAVFIFSPLEERERHVTECLIRKIPVFCVAPLAQDLETVRRLVSLARKTGTLLSCNSLGWGGGNAKLYRFCREKLCGSGGLLGKCVRMSSESYVAAGQEPGNHKNGVPSSPFAPNNGSRGIEANCAFWKMVGIKSFLHNA
ncbi:MAG: Gfo/Idh/MocA family oxidoreductase [Kiritimatiellae bacterium]|nr:Gfo/Idh/MocA family oxidoreductase [Kiritimatiellia bacterium]